MANALKEISTEAKRIRKKHPKKHKKWTGYIKEAAANLKRKSKPRRKRAVGAAKSRTRKKKSAKKVLRQVETVSVRREVAGIKRKKRRVIKKKGRRYVSGNGGGGNKLLLGLAIGAGALLLINSMKKPIVTQTQLPPLQQTGNYTRNQQGEQLVNYAIAAGLAVDSISKLIQMLNSSNDEKVSSVYNSVSTTGNIGQWI